MLSVALLLAVAGPTDTWGMGGGRSWMNPPKMSGDYSRFWGYTRPSAKAQREAELAEFAMIQEKARKGDVTSMRVVGYLKLSGLVDYSDPEGAIGWFYEAAIRGDTRSMYVLGCAFEYGVGVSVDPNLARYWHGRAEAFGAPSKCQ